ncbi:MAG: hypothetical protein AAF560_10195 [Acidobacteriota bacterium]
MPVVNFKSPLEDRGALAEKALEADPSVPDSKLLDTKALGSEPQPLPVYVPIPLSCPTYIPGQTNPRAREFAEEAVKALRVLLAIHWRHGDGPPLSPRQIGRMLGEALLRPENGDPEAVAAVAAALRDEVAERARNEPADYQLYEVVPAYAEVANERFGPCFPPRAVNNFEHLFYGFAQGFVDSGLFTPQAAYSLFEKYATSMMTWNVLSTAIIQCGVVYGILERFYTDIKGIIDAIGLILDQEELQRVINTIARVLYDPEAEQEAFEMGHMLALAFLQPILNLVRASTGFWFLWELGKLLGPIFLDILLWIFGVGPGSFAKQLVTGPVGVTTVARIFTKHLRRAVPKKVRVPDQVQVFRTTVRQLADNEDSPVTDAFVERLRDPELHDLVDEIVVAIDDDVAGLDDSLEIMGRLSDKELRGLAWYQRIFRGAGRADHASSTYKSGKGTPGASYTFTNPNVDYRYRKDPKTGKSIRRATNAGGAHFDWHNFLTDFPEEFCHNLFDVLDDLGPKMVDDSIRFPLGAIMRGGKEAQGAWGSLLAAQSQLRRDPNLAFRFEVPDHVIAPSFRQVEYDFIAYRARTEGELRALATVAETLDPDSFKDSPLVEVVVRAESKDYRKSNITEGGRIRDQMMRYLVDAIENGDLEFKKFAYFVPASNETKLRAAIESELLEAFDLPEVESVILADSALDISVLRAALVKQIGTKNMVRTYGHTPGSVSAPVPSSTSTTP